MADVYMKRGDRSPVYLETLLEPNGLAANLSGRTVRFRFRPVLGGDELGGDAMVLDEEAGIVSYAWSATDTLTAGDYNAEWEATDSMGRKETYPNDRQLRLVIAEDLG